MLPGRPVVVKCLRMLNAYLRQSGTQILKIKARICKATCSLKSRLCVIESVETRTMANLQPVTHVIFDLDGLLLDSEPLYHEAQSNIVARFGKEYTSDLRPKIMGTVEMDTARIFVEELGLPITAAEFVKLQTEEVTARMPNVPLLPGARDLIMHLHSHGIPMAVATSSSREHIALKFQKHEELFSLMQHVVSGSSDEEVKKGKPAPDVFLVCASKFDSKPPPEKVLVFEDAPNGVVAARAAGMQVVMVPEDHVPEEKRREATLVIKSLEEFQPELFGLPPFER